MGHIRHVAIIVTFGDYQLEKVKGLIKSIEEISPRQVSNIVDSPVNGYQSFFIAPDGSKLGWQHSQDGEDQRKRIIELLEEGDPYVSYVEVMYGDDDGRSEILNHN